MKSNIAIVGAGPAGSSLAIRLAGKGFTVTLIEREKFPRHKLCGEFISPECLSHFADLGVLDKMIAAGGDRVSETSFYAPGGKSVTIPSSFFSGGNALSLSRAEMDLRLMERAKETGVEVLENAAVTELLFDGEKIKGVRARLGLAESVSINADVVVDATGRTAVLSRLLAKSIARNAEVSVKPGFVGFKAHLRNVNLQTGRCEIYAFRGGYGGITHIEDDKVNLCFLIKADIVRNFKGNADEIVRRIVMRNVRAAKALADSELAAEWLAVAVSGFGRKQLSPAPGLFTVGDSAAFIDPFTGSGMLLALESSELLAEAIFANAGSPALIAKKYERDYRMRFGTRLRMASLLRQAAFVPAIATAAIRFAGASVLIAELLARFTRQRAISVVSKR